jgi:hypothetical protein
MSNTYTWVVDSLDCVPTLDGQTNVVSCIHWRVNAASSETKIITNFNGTTQTVPMYETTIYGTQLLTYMTGSLFTPYTELTEEIVLQWVKAAMGAETVTSIQTNLDNQIANLVNPPIVTPTLPWSN